MYEVSEAFHKQYEDMYDQFVRIFFKDGSVRIGLFNDECYEDSSILCQIGIGLLLFVFVCYMSCQTSQSNYHRNDCISSICSSIGC